MSNKACFSQEGCVYTAQKGAYNILQLTWQTLADTLIKSSFQIGFVMQDTKRVFI